ncbi:MAG: DUF2779 domain-containing protein [Verrucomicrobiota bacterium]
MRSLTSLFRPKPASQLLSKSDFQVASTCATKLYYRKKRYPSRNAQNEYLELLANGGFLVEFLAQHQFPRGAMASLSHSPTHAGKDTKRKLRTKRETVLFEATFLDGPYLARVDILRKHGNEIDLIEVKSASVDLEQDPTPFRGERGTILSSWMPYLTDLTFQTLVVEALYPECTIRPYLYVVDKSQPSPASTTLEHFQVDRSPNRGRPTIHYHGNAADLEDVPFLALLDASLEVNELRDAVRESRKHLTQFLDPLTKAEAPIGDHCKHCEFRGGAKGGNGLDGFAECWGELADASPHVLDLYRVDLLGGRSRDLPAELAAQGRADVGALAEEDFQGAVASRQQRQIAVTEAQEEWFSDALESQLDEHAAPYHFVDFEGARFAIPYFEGMHPYEQVGFQWSCHTLTDASDPNSLSHAEWLHEDLSFPNFTFAQRLREQVGDEGTIYVWSSYEQTMLRDIRDQLDRYPNVDFDQRKELATWLDHLLDPDSPRIVDLCALAREHYIHPDMKGSVSIKAVFPAIWKANAKVRSLPCFPAHGETATENPYALLPKQHIGGKDEVVREGTAAIRAYQEMIFGPGRTSEKDRERYRKLLLQYCHLDTAAMVAIWWHWREQATTPLMA